MEIVFSKKLNGQHTIACNRKDGSSTWMRSDPFFILHDLSHYAAESILGLKKAFYGMLAAGTDINDFELPKDQRTVVFTPEAIWTEQLVNLLGIEYNQGIIDSFAETLNEICDKDEIAKIRPAPSAEQLNQVRESIRSLMAQWQQLPEGRSMIVNFEE